MDCCDRLLKISLLCLTVLWTTPSLALNEEDVFVLDSSRLCVVKSGGTFEEKLTLCSVARWRALGIFPNYLQGEGRLHIVELISSTRRPLTFRETNGGVAFLNSLKRRLRKSVREIREEGRTETLYSCLDTRYLYQILFLSGQSLGHQRTLSLNRWALRVERMGEGGGSSLKNYSKAHVVRRQLNLLRALSNVAAPGFATLAVGEPYENHLSEILSDCKLRIHVSRLEIVRYEGEGFSSLVGKMEQIASAGRM